MVDAFNERVHVFDATAMPPKYAASVKLREQPGWVTFGLDGKYAYPSTGRGDRHRHEEGCGDAGRRERRAGAQREDGGDPLQGRRAGRRRRPVRTRAEGVIRFGWLTRSR